VTGCGYHLLLDGSGFLNHERSDIAYKPAAAWLCCMCSALLGSGACKNHKKKYINCITSIYTETAIRLRIASHANTITYTRAAIAPLTSSEKVIFVYGSVLLVEEA
jgi:hypothetical protein